MTRTRLAAVAALLLGLPLLGGCNRQEAEQTQPGGGVSQEGLSPDEIRQQVEPMSPEQAEELGIVDTTIHLEKLTSPDDSALMRDTARALRRDTTS